LNKYTTKNKIDGRGSTFDTREDRLITGDSFTTSFSKVISDKKSLVGVEDLKTWRGMKQ